MRAAINDKDRFSSRLMGRIRKREFEANAYPYAISGEEPDGAVMSYRDITEERRLQQEVIQQEKMAAIGMLAGGVAHEINNPLGGILAFTQLLLRGEGKDENSELHRDLKEIENAAIRCKRIVADLLDFSRISKERERCTFDVNLLLEKVLPFISSEIRSLNVKLKLDVAGDLPRVQGVPDRMQQVFLNLMTNACHAMPKGGTLSVKTGANEDGDRVVVSVSDTGEGIPEDVLDKIFDPFFTTKKPGKGTGLGLSISYRIVKEHEGSIEVESKPGEGTAFTVSLPAAREEEL
jgi:two-component system NtrC family sensor kinase